MKRKIATIALCGLSCCVLMAQKQLDITVKNTMKTERTA